MFVTLYERSQHYGGAEEGGWYYQWYEPISTPVKIKVKFGYNRHGEWIKTVIGKYKEVYQKVLSQVREFGRYGYEGGIVAYTEKVRYENKSRHTPHYE